MPKGASTDFKRTLTSLEEDAYAEPGVKNIRRAGDANTESQLPILNVVQRTAIALATAVTIARPRGSPKSWHALSSATAAVDSAADEYTTRAQIRLELYRVLALARNETFYEGLSSAFSERLRRLVVDFGAPLIAELANAVSADGVPPDIAFEALTTLADLNFASIAVERRLLLERALLSPVPEIRYGAALGAVAVRDSAVASVLRKAIEREQLADLRRNFEKILAALTGR
jgi:hypothetical protein